jgi:hypothetical protein
MEINGNIDQTIAPVETAPAKLESLEIWNKNRLIPHPAFPMSGMMMMVDG